ncbi:hypothetical protein FACS1894211_04390 [Clostridia bacterium]|nr:hypothetical protein FACS1894211_04390 [Clostridia bacterium]
MPNNNFRASGRYAAIENDVFDVARRIREIDSDYFVVFDRKLRRFEVHHRRQSDTLALVIPWPSLDCRAVPLVLRTRVENADKLWREMERQNANGEQG